MRNLPCVMVLGLMVMVVGCKRETEATRRSEPGTSAAVTSQPSTAAIYNARCPVGKDPVDPGVETVTYDGKVWGFCCDSCVPTFKKDPAKYAAAYEAEKAKGGKE